MEAETPKGPSNRFQKGNIYAARIGEVRNPQGKPPGAGMTILNQLKEKSGEKKARIAARLLEILELNQEALTTIAADANASILERTLAIACLDCFKSKRLDTLQFVFTRVFGSPKQEMQIDQNVTAEKQSIKLPDGTIILL